MNGARTIAAALAVAGILALAGCGGDGRDSGGLTAGDRQAAQASMDALRNSNIPIQLTSLTQMAQEAPAACRVHLESRDPRTFRVYVFWIPYVGSEAYAWLDMRLTADVSRDRFHLGMEKAVLPGGKLSPDRRSVDPWTLDTTVLKLYGSGQAKHNLAVLRAHAGDAFSKPGARCQLLMNGSLRLVPGT